MVRCMVDPHIQVHIPNLPQQQGVADCGVYAIAYDFHAARGDSLEDIEFEQDKMRQHLARCLTKQKLTPLPHSQRRARVPPCDVPLFVFYVMTMLLLFL